MTKQVELTKPTAYFRHEINVLGNLLTAIRTDIIIKKPRRMAADLVAVNI